MLHNTHTVKGTPGCRTKLEVVYFAMLFPCLLFCQSKAVSAAENCKNCDCVSTFVAAVCKNFVIIAPHVKDFHTNELLSLSTDLEM